ncbi:DUF1444 domain-containing protein [Bacillus solimangrovi]|uniref:UPF0354 protein BFG57_03320 n=1 Tax=Bacillus solimangrovi TaxID=1305675 RepID=A0A1E5LCU7_9BACI|nr:DUF1444 domain-containing protein [Bacillus solimangrovi]OEH91912.1 hypothetical protein BFG57_03320 [Bacillus solimangrovi]
MDTKKMRKELETRLEGPNRILKFDREKDELRVELSETNQGISISLPGVIAKYEERKSKAIDEVVYHIEEALKAMEETQELQGKEKYIFPVVRAASFPVETKDGKPLIYEEHTAETRIYYALDLGNSYRLIDEPFAENEGLTHERLKEIARFNARSLSTEMKSDEVAGNTFYFLNSNDGYDASRLLNETFLEKFAAEVQGEMAIAVPHADVLIMADIRNEMGYDILAQMAMSFFAEGRVPITAMSFLYENKELEPIFILAQKKPKRKE